jgi:hypothetical protein
LRLIGFNYFAGDEAFAGEVLALAVGEGLEVVTAGLLAGFDGFDEAGRSPRLLGSLTIFAARLLTTLASEIATSTNAAFRISLR